MVVGRAMAAAMTVAMAVATPMATMNEAKPPGFPSRMRGGNPGGFVAFLRFTHHAAPAPPALCYDHRMRGPMYTYVERCRCGSTQEQESTSCFCSNMTAYLFVFP